MLYKDNWSTVQQRYREFWALENHDRPLLHITAPKGEGPAAPTAQYQSTRERWFSIDHMLSSAHHRFQNTYYGGEAFPVLSPDLGPDLFAALYGVPLEFGENTSWALHNLNDWDEHRAFVLDKAGVYYRQILEMTQAAVEDGKDKYFVGITDIHPGLDALVAMRSPQELCIDTLEVPHLLKQASMELFQGFKELYGDLRRITGRYQQGSSNWMQVWHPESWYVTSCDFICMISPAQFDELVVDELNAELNFLDASIFHLDGPDALRHLDRLLGIQMLDGIQWVYGAGQPTAAHWVDVLKKIQAAGKCFVINATPADMPVLLENLKPEGAMYMVEAGSIDEAVALEKMVDIHK